MKKISSILLLLVLAMFALPAQAGTIKAPGLASGASVLADDDDEEEPPYVEPAFTVYLDIDNADAVYLTVNEKAISHTAGLNEITVDPGDGYIKVHVNDGFAFTKFYDETQKSDFLQYDYQTMPVTIRKIIGIGDSEAMVTDGDTFTVRTIDMASFEQFTLTVNVDNAAKTEMKIGTSIDIFSSTNRLVPLTDGSNTVTYTAVDKYLHLSGASLLEPLQSVTLNGAAVPNDGTMNAVYTIPLSGAKTAGSVIEITAAPDIVEDPFSFTATFDDIDKIKYVSKMPADKNMTFSEGENTFTFKTGDYYEIWTYGPALSCTFNGDELDYNTSLGLYKFYPNNGGVLVMRFKEDGPKPKSFTITIDDASMVDSFFDSETDEEFDLVDGVNTFEITKEGREYALAPVNRTRAYSFTLDGEDVAMHRNRYYCFTPEDGSEVVVLFHEPVIPVNPEVTINVDNASNVIVYKGSYAAASTIINLVDGVNTFNLEPTDEKINVVAAEGALIYSIIDGDGHLYEPDDNMVFTADVIDGLTLTIKTVKVDYDKSFIMILEDPEGKFEGAEMITGAEREIAIDEVTEVRFNSDYDQFMLFAFSPQPEGVFVNGQELTDSPDMPGVYFFAPEDGDIVRVYFDKPQTHAVKLEVGEEIAGQFAILRDLMQTVEPASGNMTELHGTYYVVIPDDEDTKMEVILSSGDPAQSTSVEMEDGAYLFRIEADMTVSIRGERTFTATFDDIESISRIVKMPAAEDQTFVTGENAYTFMTGDYYEIYTSKPAIESTLDGEKVEYDQTDGLYRINPTDGGSLVMRFIPIVHEVTITVDNADNIVVYKGYQATESTIISIVDGTNTLSLDETVEKLSISRAEGSMIDSVTDGDGVVCRPDFDGDYTFDVVDGLNLTVKTTKVVFDKTFIMIVEDPDGKYEGADMKTGAQREIEVGTITEISFNSAYDQYIYLSPHPLPDAVYVNGVEVEEFPGIGNIYFIAPKDRDIVRIYYTGDKAEVHDVTFDVAQEVADKFAIVRDKMQTVDHSSGNSSELHGTYYVITPAEDANLEVTLLPVGRVEAPATDSEQGIKVPLEDGTFSFRVESDMIVNIKEADSSAVSIVTTDGAQQAIYNLQGLRIYTDDINKLPAGIYIVGGRKIYVR